MKTIRQAIKELGPSWGSMFEALYWNEAEGYYFAKKDYWPCDFICFQDEYEAVAKEMSTDAHKRNTAQMVELNELCQQHGIGKIGDSVVPALKTYIKNIQGTLDLTERLIISEIGDYIAGLDCAGIQQAHNDQMQHELITRVQRVFTDVKQQTQPTVTPEPTPGYDAARKRIIELMQSPLMLESTEREFELLVNLVVEYESLKYPIPKAGAK